jgi:hypothetical protein
MAGLDLGSFGKRVQEMENAVAVEPDHDTFTFFDVKIRLREWISPLPMMRMAEVMDARDARLVVPIVARVHAVIEASVLEDDWATFNDLAAEYSADFDLLEEVAEHLFILWCRRPSRQSSGSSNGQPDDKTEEKPSEPSSESSPDFENPDSSESPIDPQLAAMNA